MKVFKKQAIIALFFLFYFSNTYTQKIVFESNENFDGTYTLIRYYGNGLIKVAEKQVSGNSTKLEFIPNNMITGIYALVFPDSTSFEFMTDVSNSKNYTFSLDESKISMAIGSDQTQMFLTYNNFINKATRENDSIRLLLKQADLKNKERRKALKHRDNIRFTNDSLTKLILLDFNGQLLGNYLLAQERINIPLYEPPSGISNPDSAKMIWQLSYYKKHYLDNLKLDDPDLINTPVYTDLINTYLTNVTQQNIDDLTLATTYILDGAAENIESKRFTTNYLLIWFNRKKNMAVYESVYLHILKNYYLNGKAYWMSNEDINKLSREYNRLLPLSYGKQAPAIVLNSDKNNSQSLYATDAKYTILYFHSYDCSICKSTGKSLQKLMYKVNPEQVKTFAVCLGKDSKQCRRYAKQYTSENWINVYGEKNIDAIALKYQLEKTPTIYLLDERKAIIEKNLTIRQLDRFLEGVLE